MKTEVPLKEATTRETVRDVTMRPPAEHREVMRPWYKKRGYLISLAVLVLLVAAAITAAILMTGGGGETTTAPTEITQEFTGAGTGPTAVNRLLSSTGAGQVDLGFTSAGSGATTVNGLLSSGGVID